MEGGGQGLLHAVAKAWLRYRLTVSCRRLVAVAVGLLWGHGYAGARCQHQLRCACNTEVIKSLVNTLVIHKVSFAAVELIASFFLLLLFHLLNKCNVTVRKLSLSQFYKGTDNLFSQSTASCSHMSTLLPAKAGTVCMLSAFLVFSPQANAAVRM